MEGEQFFVIVYGITKILPRMGAFTRGRSFLAFLRRACEERRKRVHKRNKETDATFAFEVTGEMFDYVESMFVPPSDEELQNGTRIV